MAYLPPKIVRQVFTSSGTYTPTKNMVYCDIEVVGGGGGSGGCGATGATTIVVTGGGAAGGYARGLFTTATIGASQTVTIGAAGAAGTNAPGNGGTGGTTSVGSLISATGGTGSLGSNAAIALSVIQLGIVAGGAGTGGDFQTTGGAGGAPFGFYSAATGAVITNAEPGLVFFGGSSAVAGPASSYGAGGTGAGNGINIGATVGNAGFKGVVVVTEYLSH